jgi:anti-sigma factor RsiW
MAVILADVERRKNLPDWKKDGGQFVPNPATYINGRRWEDSTAQVVSIMRGVI